MRLKRETIQQVILLRFCYDPEMIFRPTIPDHPEAQELLLQAGFARQQILLAPLNPRLELEWQLNTALEATHHSTAIEGNPLTLEEVRRLLSGKPLQKPRNREIEVRNYKNALDEVLSDWTASRKAVTATTILHLHRSVMRDLELPARLGQWRVDPVFVFDTKTQIPVHEGDPASEVSSRIAALCVWLNNADAPHPVIRAAIAHLEFVRIHPFMDGNGRSARLLETLLLAQFGWNARGLLALEPYYRANLARYYALIASSINDGDYTDWVTFVAAGVLERLQKVEQQLVHDSPANSHAPMLNERQWRIMALLGHARATVSNMEVQRLTSASHMTAARDLASLVQIGLLEKHGAGRATRYSRRAPRAAE